MGNRDPAYGERRLRWRRGAGCGSTHPAVRGRQVRHRVPAAGNRTGGCGRGGDGSELMLCAAGGATGGGATMRYRRAQYGSATRARSFARSNRGSRVPPAGHRVNPCPPAPVRQVPSPGRQGRLAESGPSLIWRSVSRSRWWAIRRTFGHSPPGGVCEFATGLSCRLP